MTTATVTTPRAGAFAVPVRATRYWWAFLAIGLAWLLFAVILFRFDYTTVRAISILFAVGAFGAGAFEFAVTIGVSGGWKIAHALLGVAFVAAGVVALIHPGDTFVALAAVISVVLVVLGAFDVTTAFMTRTLTPGWWLQLLVGIAEILLGFWAAGSWDLSVVLLVAWVAAFALMRGITAIVIGLRLWEVRRPAAGV